MNTLTALLATGGVAALVSGVFNLAVLLLNRRWAKKDRENDRIVELEKKIDTLSDKMDGYIAVNDERNATQCRARILQFADELVNEPDRRHTQGQFEHVLNDITEYNDYCAAHPDYRNKIAEKSAEIIEQVYKKCALEHKFI